jgi:hypothetical protein
MSACVKKPGLKAMRGNNGPDNERSIKFRTSKLLKIIFEPLYKTGWQERGQIHKTFVGIWMMNK